MSHKETWKEELESVWNHAGLHLGYKNKKVEIIKSFISSLLQDRDRELRGKVEALRGTVFGNDIVSRADVLALLDTNPTH